MRKTATAWALILLCLLLALPGAGAETRQGVIYLEGMEEIIEETLFESPDGFSFWYANDSLTAAFGTADGIEGVVVSNPYSGDHMVLSIISRDAAVDYARNIEAQSANARVQTDVYRVLEKGRYSFLTLIADNGQYLRAVGGYSREAAEGTAKYFQRVLDSVSLLSEYDADFLRVLPGQWAEEYEGAGTVLTLNADGSMALDCYSLNGEFAYSCQGTWRYEPVPDYSGHIRLHFTATGNPAYAGSAYSVECVYDAYTESWVENDTEFTYLILNPLLSCTGISPFEEVYGDANVALHREKGPNMRVVRCKEFVSLRETRSTTAKRLAKVPLGALVLAYPEYGEANGFLYCVYHDEEGYILAEYLQPLE